MKTKEELQARRAELKKRLQAEYALTKRKDGELIMQVDNAITRDLRREMLEIDDLLDGMVPRG